MPNKKQSKILDDFVKNAEGKYEYVGALHRYVGNIPRKKAYFNLGVLTVLLLACAIIAGSVRAAGATYEIYIVVPYIFVMLMCGLLTYKFIELLLGKDPLRDYIHQSTVVRFPFYLWIILIAACITLVGEVIYLFQHGVGEYLNGTILFVCSMLLVSLLAFLWLRYFKLLVWEEIQNEKQ